MWLQDFLDVLVGFDPEDPLCASEAISRPCKMAVSVFAPKPFRSLDAMLLAGGRAVRRAWRR